MFMFAAARRPRRRGARQPTARTTTQSRCDRENRSYFYENVEWSYYFLFLEMWVLKKNEILDLNINKTTDFLINESFLLIHFSIHKFFNETMFQLTIFW